MFNRIESSLMAAVFWLLSITADEADIPRCRVSFWTFGVTAVLTAVTPFLNPSGGAVQFALAIIRIGLGAACVCSLFRLLSICMHRTAIFGRALYALPFFAVYVLASLWRDPPLWVSIARVGAGLVALSMVIWSLVEIIFDDPTI